MEVHEHGALDGAVFLAIRIGAGELVPAWAIVAACDGSVAVVQIILLCKGWWKEVGR